MSGVDVLRVTFYQSGDFAAINAARSWCDDRGISYGSMQRDAPIGLLAGEFRISKWRNMTEAEHAMLHGSIFGDMRNGPVTLEINRNAIEVIGLEVTDCTGVLIGNTDIQSPEWVPTEVVPGTTPLDTYPKQADMEPKP